MTAEKRQCAGLRRGCERDSAKQSNVDLREKNDSMWYVGSAVQGLCGVAFILLLRYGGLQSSDAAAKATLIIFEKQCGGKWWCV